MQKIKFVLTFFALFHFQFNYSEVDTNINKEHLSIFKYPPSKKEKKAPNANYTHKEKKLKNFKPSVTDESELKEFCFHEKEYIVNFPIDMVWEAYESTKPNECWADSLAKYKESYADATFHNFQEENHPSFIEGCVYLIRLKVIPFIKINILFKLTKLDQSKKLIELTYGMDNTSHGKQTIQLIEDGNKTIIKHTTYFKSKSKFRDKRLYSKFHVKYIDEFHANIQKKLIANYPINNPDVPQNSNDLEVTEL